MSSNRRTAKPGQRKTGRKSTRKPSGAAKKRRPAARGKANQRAKPCDRKSKRERKPRDPQEFKTRNRTLLVLGVLAAVNAYMFLGKGRNQFSDMQLESAAMAGDGAAFAVARQDRCTGDPVRIFAGLSDQVFLESQLDGDRGLRLALLDLGFEGAEVDAVEAKVRASIDLGLLQRAHSQLRAAADADMRISALELEVGEGHVVQLCRRGDELELRNLQHPLRTDIAVVAAKVPASGDLLGALEAQGEGPELVREVAHTLAHDLDVSYEPRPGDRFQVLVEKRYLGKHFHRYGTVLAIRYLGPGRNFGAYRYKPKDGSEAFYDRTGQPIARAALQTPLAWVPVDARARERMRPRLDFIAGESGLAYDRARGVPVVAQADGTVVSSGPAGEDGTVLEIELDDGWRVRYAHLDRVLGDLSAGRRVKQGRPVALVGQSGRAGHAQLRLEVRNAQGEVVDPESWMRDARGRKIGRPLDGEELEQFSEDLAPWRRAMIAAAR